MNNVAKNIIDILIAEEGRDKRILFLPYKIEMWDSMESVFKECVRRRLSVAVQPIRYMFLEHHKIVDSKMDEWGNDVREYTMDIDKFDPDIVFIHYPFDSQNTITTIPEAYYSSNLKARGRRRIAYLSYHGNSALEHEMLLPAVTRADYIFVYDEAEKQRYYKVWSEHGIKSEAKIFATGTPKLDAYIRAYQISCKHNAQSILIANSLMPFINDIYRISKYKAIIENEHKSEIIYRPHPLLEETLKRTNLWRYEDYKNFLKYIESNNVTIDKNKYIKDTLCHCKKLYCDWASIYILCRDEKLFEVEAIL